ncbi:MAG: LarC family nickel insertion protein [Gemmatimonadaceae bacterium]|nr:LarC family nickel insertion protein [Gemmatimonadaceae bacterium]
MATSLVSRIHLDPIGGIAGDMFAAALADAFPDSVAELLVQLRKLPHPEGAEIYVQPHRDAVLGGCRFVASAPLSQDKTASHEHGAGQASHQHHARHAHAHYAAIRRMLSGTALKSEVRNHALGLFALLAEAEAEVHGTPLDSVTFHEVGAWDSIVDFVAAAFWIDAVGPCTWTWSAPPLGGGRIHSAHGPLAIPAPATAILLRGMALVDDGIHGERVTPTGAAILKYLHSLGASRATSTPLRIVRTGNGFGTRTLPGISNVLRCLVFEHAEPSFSIEEDVVIATFEIDDQTAEDLAHAIELLRHALGVLDVLQSSVVGKKGRLGTQVQVLAQPAHLETILRECFSQTSTLGLRLTYAKRRTLSRELLPATADRPAVKLASRPDMDTTAKAEMDDVAALATSKAERDRLRRQAETDALGRRL